MVAQYCPPVLGGRAKRRGLKKKSCLFFFSKWTSWGVESVNN